MAVQACGINTSTSVVFCLMLGGCTINPVPGNYLPLTSKVEREFESSSGVRENFTTINIVRQIRCEARYSVASVTMDLLRANLKSLRSNTSKSHFEQQFVSQISIDDDFDFDSLVNTYFDDKTGKAKDPRIFSLGKDSGNRLGLELEAMERFAQSGVGYTFTFTISENNNLTNGVLGFNFPRTARTLTLGLGGQYTRSRQNTRTFSFAESIFELVFDPKLEELQYCNERKFKEKRGKNWHFPIYGSVGLKDTFQTYAWLPFVSSFGKNKKATGVKDTDLFVDELEFTTVVDVNATPSVTISPGVNRANISNASGAFGKQRSDQHQLRIAIKTEGIEGLDEVLRTERLLEAQASGGGLN